MVQKLYYFQVSSNSLQGNEKIAYLTVLEFKCEISNLKFLPQVNIAEKT